MAAAATQFNAAILLDCGAAVKSSVCASSEPCYGWDDCHTAPLAKCAAADLHLCYGLNSIDTYDTYYLSCRAAQAQIAQVKPEEPLQLQPVHIPDPSDPLTLDLNLPADATLQ